MNWKSKDDMRKYYRGYMANYREKAREKPKTCPKVMTDKFILKAF